MSFARNRNTMKYLGSLRGEGALAADIEEGAPTLGRVSYEIDGYSDRSQRTAAGCIEGDAHTLTQAYEARNVHLRLSSGSTSVELVLADPRGGSWAEVTITGPFPL